MKTYVILEIVVGCSGLVLLPLLLNLDRLMALSPEYGTSLTLKFAVSFVLLSIPTICMGATFPVMAAVLVRVGDTAGQTLSHLYMLNTGGAVLGALLSGFLLIPALGLDGAIYVAVALNLLAATLAVWIWRRAASPLPSTMTEVSAKEPYGEQPNGGRRILLLMFITGFTSIATEVGWTKYLAIYTGATLYGFAAILTVFLFGIAAGAWLASRLLKRGEPGLKAVLYGLLAVGTGLVLARVALTGVPETFELSRSVGDSALAQHAVKYLVVLVVLVVPTVCFGAMFPILMSRYCGAAEHIRARVGPAYAVNTVGSILGAIAAGFWLIPMVGTDSLLTTMAVIMLLSPLVFPEVVRRSAAVAAVSTVAILAAWFAPHLNFETLIASARYRFDTEAMAGKTPTFLFLEEGRSSVISLVTYDGEIARLQSNGIQESFLALNPRWDPPMIETLLGLMPYFLHDDPNNALVIGFGGGTTVNAMAATDLDAIHVVELEPAVVEAVASANRDGILVVGDPRVRLSFNDARNTLLVEDTTYDLIVSQPSHPWLAGSGNLFTRQFFEIARSRLRGPGIFAQWVNLFNMDAATLRSILQAYYGVFAHGFCIASPSTGDLLLFGSGEPIHFDFAKIEARMLAPRVAEQLYPWRIERPEALLDYFALSRSAALEAAGDAPENTDTRILTEVRLAGMVADPASDASPYELLDRHYRVDLLPFFDAEFASEYLYRSGRYFLEQGWRRQAEDVLDDLRGLDPGLAERLSNELDGRQ
jgi:spermidine synthase